MSIRLKFLSAVCVAGVLLAGCGASTTTSHTTRKTHAMTPISGHATVQIRNFMYHPMALTVTAGTKVTFHNDDQTSHTATALNGTFDTGTIKPGRSATVVLRRAGIDKYHCLFHAFMVARIVVVPAGSG
jgi:plastocyanin